MRLTVLLFAAMLGAQSDAAQQVQPSPAERTPSSQQDGAVGLPVSVEKIRKALEESRAAKPGTGLRGLDEKPHFRIEIRERQRIEELLATLDFKSPVVPGGLYAYEQQQNLWPKVNNPFAQPYAAFSQGELLQVSITSWLIKYFAGRLANAVSSAYRSREEQAARDEVVRALAEFCAAQPYRGRGILGCDALSAAVR